MTVIITVLFILIFFVFIGLGTISHFENTGIKWFYFSLSILGLIGTILMFVFFHWDLAAN